METPPSDSSAPPKRSLSARLAPLILVAGAAASASILIPKMPRERRVELRLEDASTIVGVEVAWARSSSTQAQPAEIEGKDEPVQGAIWHFEAGAAPPSVTTTVRLPDGPYDLDVVVQRVERTDSVRRSLTLGDADQIAVPIR